jgi:hypothetical protein
MKDQKQPPHPPEKDRLVTRPEGELPTPMDPAGPEARGWPDDPKPDPVDPTSESPQNDPERTA